MSCTVVVTGACLAQEDQTIIQKEGRLDVVKEKLILFTLRERFKDKESNCYHMHQHIVSLLPHYC